MKPSLTDTLWTRCGLCCDGSLFADAGLASDDEATALEVMGLEIEDSDEDEGGLLLQPCGALKGKRCSIYVDFRRLYAFVDACAFFVTRSKKGIQFNRLESRPVDYMAGVRFDHIVRLRNPATQQHYPDKLRRIRYFDQETQRDLVFLTNNLSLPSTVIAFLYKCRWKVELFFKWIKQNLRIKHFYGTSDNAVKTQVWIAICVYVLVAILRKQLQSERSLSEIIQIISVSAFEKVPLQQLLATSRLDSEISHSPNQLLLWD